ncbi:hypothetical protein T492DRAFT_869608 [Pavlovales sp. CCMP2436]|nr:hypothetical protein T492DRAFT_869608 [Pavlovales sp. CCMP2436]
MVWVEAWAKSVPTTRAALSAPLLARDLKTDADSKSSLKSGALCVNLDDAVPQLLAEARHLLQLGVPVPDGAAALLHAAPRLRAHANALTAALATRGAPPP